MTTLLRGGTVVNVFTGELWEADVLIEGDRIATVGKYGDQTADCVRDVSGKFICPGFIDGHIHIESTMLRPSEFAKVCVPHGTTTVVCDPHEIANVCGADGIRYMLSASESLMLRVFVMLPSCVPATPFDESGASLDAAQLRPFYDHPRVLGLAEMMNAPGVLSHDREVWEKLEDARARRRPMDGHAPLLSGKDLDRYISAGIHSDHECSGFDEALERVRKGQWLMIRQGSAARNLQALLPFFDPPYAHRCLLVTDDRHPADLLRDGHIDAIIREAVRLGKSPVTGIQMATIQAAQCFGLRDIGAVAPGYLADLLVLDSLDDIAVRDVYCAGVPAVSDGAVSVFPSPPIPDELENKVHHTFHVSPLAPEDFYLSPRPGRCRVIRLREGQLLTSELLAELPWESNGVDVRRDILKLAVVERHHGSGHIGLGFVQGLGLKNGAIASSVSHDSHNLIVVGTDERDMAAAANRVIEREGGYTVAADGEVVGELPLPIAGLMSDGDAESTAAQNARLLSIVHTLGVPVASSPFMTLSFISLPVIPDLKMTTQGLVDVSAFQRVSLWESGQ